MRDASIDQTLEAWAGIECTVNRVKDDYCDQLELNGHYGRLSDLDRFAALGIRALRYPLLWECVQGDTGRLDHWGWASSRLDRLRELSIRPILGLVHHGSGPRHTSLIDPGFADGLAEFAEQVATRFPWVADYTPVNEPLTTARFSGLYGHWYPHGVDELTFARALVTECRATVLAMRAIRKVNPAARLVQTEDLGKTYGTQRLTDQVNFDNTRRWLSLDLLCGRVRPDHRMWGHLLWVGIPQSELEWFIVNPCPPDIIGINHYLTSERFLDHRLSRYPGVEPGGNGRDRYVDLEAVRVCAPGVAGPEGVMREAWERFKIPIAVTEAHLGCTREEQMRWLLEVWNAAESLRRRGADVRAVTAWSLLGAYDWDSLLTRFDGRYEPGVFDLRASEPRCTAIGHLLRNLAQGEKPSHPVLAAPGWWRSPRRFLHPPVHIDRGSSAAKSIKQERQPAMQPLLITGARGTLGRAFARLCVHRGIAHRLAGRHEMDIASEDDVARVLRQVEPWAVINAAGFIRVDDAEHETSNCLRDNATGPGVLARACASEGIPLITFSSDLVFDGAKGSPYVESDPVCPQNTYGMSKAAAESAVLEIHPGAMVVRSGPFFGPWETDNFVFEALRALSAGQPFFAADDAVISPTYIPDLVHACLDLLIDGESGLWHLANQGSVTWRELAERACDLAGVSSRTLVGRPTSEFRFRAPRPQYNALGSERADIMPSLDQALRCFVSDSGAHWRIDGAPVGDEAESLSNAA